MPNLSCRFSTYGKFSIMNQDHDTSKCQRYLLLSSIYWPKLSSKERYSPHYLLIQLDGASNMVEPKCAVNSG